MRNVFLAAPVFSYALIATLVPTKGQAEVVKLYCITKIYENGEPQFAVIDDMKIDFDHQTINDRPVPMTTENNVVSWKYSSSDGTTSSTLNKSTWDYSSATMRPDGTHLRYIGTCSLNCSLFDTLPPLQRRSAYLFCR
jgi:hypothetical protein